MPKQLREMRAIINFFTEDIVFKISEKSRLRKWIINAIKQENKIPGDINLVFTSDNYLLVLNKKYFERNELTDTITFPLSEEEVIVSGDAYISIDRIHENASKYKITFEEEFRRVIIHSLLHLVGYDDLTIKEKRIMTEKEDYLLAKY